MEQKTYPAEKAGGGEMVLNAPLRRFVFLGSLIPLFCGAPERSSREDVGLAHSPGDEV
jgi:hypothetical protein